MLNQNELYGWLVFFATVGGAIGFFVFTYKGISFLLGLLNTAWWNRGRPFLRKMNMAWLKMMVRSSLDPIIFLYFLATRFLGIFISALFIGIYIVSNDKIETSYPLVITAIRVGLYLNLYCFLFWFFSLYFGLVVIFGLRLRRKNRPSWRRFSNRKQVPVP